MEEKKEVRSIDQLFKTDKKLEVQEGVILDYGDFRVRIARAGGSNKKFSRLLQAKMKPFRRQMETDTMDEEVAAQIMRETYAETVILGMDVKVEDGKYTPGILRAGGVIPYTLPNVISTFQEMPDFFRDIQTQANSVALFRSMELEDDVKN